MRERDEGGEKGREGVREGGSDGVMEEGQRGE